MKRQCDNGRQFRKGKDERRRTFLQNCARPGQRFASRTLESASLAAGNALPAVAGNVI
jgi:hypothetical protein